MVQRKRRRRLKVRPIPEPQPEKIVISLDAEGYGLSVYQREALEAFMESQVLDAMDAERTEVLRLAASLMTHLGGRANAGRCDGVRELGRLVYKRREIFRASREAREHWRRDGAPNDDPDECQEVGEA